MNTLPEPTIAPKTKTNQAFPQETSFHQLQEFLRFRRSMRYILASQPTPQKEGFNKALLRETRETNG